MSNSVERCDPVEGSILKKRSRRWSEVWHHFEETPDGRAICKYCGNDLVAKSSAGTTHLKRHLENCHKRPQYVDQPPTMGIRNEVRNFGWTNEKAWEVEVKKAILAEVPFAPPDCKKALSSLTGLLDIDKEICSYYEHEKEKLANEFKFLTSRVCISYDISEKLEYISITAHFINEDFNLVKKLIGFKKLPDNYSESCVARIIKNCISDWKLGDQIFSFTGGNYSKYVSKSLRECFPPKMLLEGLYFDVPCRGALLGNYFRYISRFCLEDNGNNIENFIKAAEAVHCQMDTFNRIAKERSLPPINEDWLVQYAGKSWSWNSKNPEHWEPVVKMFKEAIPYKDIFSQYAKINCGRFAKGREGCLDLEHGGRNGLDSANLSSLCTCTELSTSYLSIIDWEAVEAAVKLFDKVHQTFYRMDNFSYPTSNLYFQNLEEIEDITTINYIMKTRNNFFRDEIWNKVYFVACVLDPRYKFIFLKYNIEKTNRPEFTKKEDINEIRELLQKMFGAYVVGITNKYANAQEEGCTSISTQQSYPLIDRFSMYTKELKEKTKKSELEEYLDEELVDRGVPSFNLLGWWKQNRLRYPILSRMARDFLAVPTCAYSIQGNISSDFRVLERASPQLLEAMICSKDWILSDVQSIPESKN